MLEKMWGKGNTFALLVGVKTGTASLDISMVISQKIMKQPSSRPSNITFEYIPIESSIIHKDRSSTMFTVALFVITRTWKQSKRIR